MPSVQRWWAASIPETPVASKDLAQLLRTDYLLTAYGETRQNDEIVKTLWSRVPVITKTILDNSTGTKLKR
uniref:Uncharacterized protein n=1 Tax=Knipowitschia caucasica TaxID=637954 RepID=A0AAV2IX30_KNICA